MNSNVNLAAPLGVLLLLGTALLLGILILATLYCVVRRRLELARLSSLIGFAIVGIYCGVTLLFSLTSNEKVLAQGQEKYFCEIDCHLAYSLVESRETKTLGPAGKEVTAAGLFHVIRIKTRFDPQTISAHRGNGFLYPNPRTVTVIDARGRRYFPSQAAEMALAQAGESSTQLTAPLRPGESYTTSVVFDLPPESKSFTLLINESDWITRLIIGHENSLLHKQTKFQI